MSNLEENRRNEPKWSKTDEKCHFSKMPELRKQKKTIIFLNCCDKTNIFLNGRDKIVIFYNTGIKLALRHQPLRPRARNQETIENFLFQLKEEGASGRTTPWTPLAIKRHLKSLEGSLKLFQFIPKL